MSIRAVALVGLVCTVACKGREEPHVVQPAPRVEAQAVAPAETPPQPDSPPEAPRTESADAPIDQPRVPAAAKASKPRPTSRPRETSPKPVATPPGPEPQLDPAPQPPAPAPKPATRVAVPNTEHVRVEVPAGLQAWLDKDTRMQPWLGKVMKVIDDCYASVRARDASATGTITFRVTMHENARPDPEIESLPGALSSVVACATGQLMRTRMPLFTGTEGESYVVRVRFQ